MPLEDFRTFYKEKLGTLSFLHKLLPDHDLLSVMTIHSFIRDPKGVYSGSFDLVFWIRIVLAIAMAPLLLPWYYTQSDDVSAGVRVIIAEHLRFLGLRRFARKLTVAQTLRSVHVGVWILAGAFGLWIISAVIPVPLWWLYIGRSLLRDHRTVKVPNCSTTSVEESHTQFLALPVVLLGMVRNFHLRPSPHSAERNCTARLRPRQRPRPRGRAARLLVRCS